mmetsp:Transcript_4098/g.13189  ORF Transcript_4098/g.13189 Transcript_4098/m.13189 type:complete len:343 (+) Transcript_4098:491-1519(+)
MRPDHLGVAPLRATAHFWKGLDVQVATAYIQERGRSLVTLHCWLHCTPVIGVPPLDGEGRAGRASLELALGEHGPGGIPPGRPGVEGRRRRGYEQLCHGIRRGVHGGGHREAGALLQGVQQQEGRLSEAQHAHQHGRVGDRGCVAGLHGACGCGRRDGGQRQHGCEGDAPLQVEEAVRDRSGREGRGLMRCSRCPIQRLCQACETACQGLGAANPRSRGRGGGSLLCSPSGPDVQQRQAVATVLAPQELHLPVVQEALGPQLAPPARAHGAASDGKEEEVDTREGILGGRKAQRENLVNAAKRRLKLLHEEPRVLAHLCVRLSHHLMPTLAVERQHRGGEDG